MSAAFDAKAGVRHSRAAHDLRQTLMHVVA
jgi:hypothetical protein